MEPDWWLSYEAVLQSNEHATVLDHLIGIIHIIFHAFFSNRLSKIHQIIFTSLLKNEKLQMTNGRWGYALRQGPPFSPCSDTDLCLLHAGQSLNLKERHIFSWQNILNAVLMPRSPQEDWCFPHPDAITGSRWTDFWSFH